MPSALISSSFLASLAAIACTKVAMSLISSRLVSMKRLHYLPHPICAAPFLSARATPPKKFRHPLAHWPSTTWTRSTLSSRRQQHRLFSTTPSAMTATKIDGTAIARSIRERLGAQIQQRQQTNARYRPSLKIVQGESNLQRDNTIVLTYIHSWRQI